MNSASPTVVVLGGYGQTGRRLVTHLARQAPTARIVVAGRDGAAAARLASQVDPEGDRVTGAAIDAADPAAVAAALEPADVLVNTASAPQHAAALLDACLVTGTDWIDTQVDRAQADVLRAAADRIAAAGRCAVTQAGFHPGVPAALVRWCAARVDTIVDAWTSGFLRPRGGFPPSSAMGELLDEFRHYQAHLFTDGEWRRARWTDRADSPEVDVAFGLGRVRTFPYDLDELRPLPAMYPSLRRLGFGVAGFDPVTDNVVTPLLIGGARLGRWTYPALSWLLVSSTHAFGRPPFGVVVQCDATGKRAGAPVRQRVAIGHDDAYELTAVPAVSMVTQVLDETARRPGLHLMGLVVEPDRLLADAAAMGCRVVAGDVPGPDVP